MLLPVIGSSDLISPGKLGSEALILLSFIGFIPKGIGIGIFSGDYQESYSIQHPKRSANIFFLYLRNI